MFRVLYVRLQSLFWVELPYKHSSWLMRGWCRNTSSQVHLLRLQKTSGPFSHAKINYSNQDSGCCDQQAAACSSTDTLQLCSRHSWQDHNPLTCHMVGLVVSNRSPSCLLFSCLTWITMLDVWAKCILFSQWENYPCFLDNEWMLFTGVKYNFGIRVSLATSWEVMKPIGIWGLHVNPVRSCMH